MKFAQETIQVFSINLTTSKPLNKANSAEDDENISLMLSISDNQSSSLYKLYHLFFPILHHLLPVGSSRSPKGNLYMTISVHRFLNVNILYITTS